MAGNTLKEISAKALQKRLAKPNKRKALQKLHFDNLVKKLTEKINDFQDRRVRNNTSKTLKDASLSAFSIFYLQRPSFLAHQKRMKAVKGKDNAQSLFGINEIVSENHIRYLLDEVCPDTLAPLYLEIIEDLKEMKYLEEFKGYNGNFFIGIDGTQYYSSKKIKCPSCSHRKHGEDSGEKISYYHCVVAPVLVKAGLSRVISLPPEFIVPQDGKEKQDCEYNGSKRWLQKNIKLLRVLGEVTILGDDLYCHQNFCQDLLNAKCNFILVCKPDSHKTLYEYIKMLDEEIEKNRLIVIRAKGKNQETDIYRFYNGLPIKNGDKGVLEVNWCEIETRTKNGETKYKNSFVTNHEITKEVVADIVAAGRARWKVENESHNVLKNNGYHLEHNFGHGEKYLSSLLVSFNLLAFLFHTILDMVDRNYLILRQAYGSRQRFFDDIQTLTTFFYFSDWSTLIEFMIEGLELNTS